MNLLFSTVPILMPNYLSTSSCFLDPTSALSLSAFEQLLTMPEGFGGSKEVTSIAFSPDSRSILVLGGGPDYPLLIFSIDKVTKVTASIRLAVNTGAHAT